MVFLVMKGTSYICEKSGKLKQSGKKQYAYICETKSEGQVLLEKCKKQGLKMDNWKVEECPFTESEVAKILKSKKSLMTPGFVVYRGNKILQLFGGILSQKDKSEQFDVCSTKEDACKLLVFSGKLDEKSSKKWKIGAIDKNRNIISCGMNEADIRKIGATGDVKLNISSLPYNKYVALKGQSVIAYKNSKCNVVDFKNDSRFCGTIEDVCKILCSSGLVDKKWVVGYIEGIKNPYIILDNKDEIKKIAGINKNLSVNKNEEVNQIVNKYVVYKGDNIIVNENGKYVSAPKNNSSGWFNTTEDACKVLVSINFKKGWAIGFLRDIKSKIEFAIDDKEDILGISGLDIPVIPSDEKTYIASNGVTFLKKDDSNNFVDTLDVLEAFTFVTKESGESILASIGRINYSLIEKTSKNYSSTYRQSVEKEIKNIIHVRSSNKICDEVDNEINKIDAIIDDLQNKYHQYKDEYEKLEKWLCDYYHLIEFYDFLDDEYDKALKILKYILIHRRNLKDNMEKIEMLTGIKESIKTTKASFLKMQKRTYCPRISNMMFCDNNIAIDIKGCNKQDGNIINTLYDIFLENGVIK